MVSASGRAALAQRVDGFAALAAASPARRPRRRTKSTRRALSDLMRLPQLAVVDVVDRLARVSGSSLLLAASRRPGGGRRAAASAARARCGTCTPLVMCPIGHSRPRRARARAAATCRGETWPCSAETPLARRDSFRAQHGHAERLRRGRPGRRGPSAMSSLVRQAQRVAQRTEVLLDQVGREAVVAGRHRRVRGEDGLRGHLGAARRRSSARRVASAGGPSRARRRRCALRSGAARPGGCPAPRARARRRRRAAAPGGCASGGRRRRAARSARGLPARCRRRRSRAGSSVQRPTATCHTPASDRPSARLDRRP